MLRLHKLAAVAVALLVVFAAVGCGSTNKAKKSSAPPSFGSIKVALLRAGATICDEVRDPNKTFGAIVGATNARSYSFAPCPNGGIVAVGSFSDETRRDKALRYLLGLDKRSFTPEQSGPIWKNGWRLGTSAVVIAADTPSAATKQIDRAMTAVHGEPVR